jgi:ATP-dependent DNA helicase RecG
VDLTPEKIAETLRLGEDSANEFKSVRQSRPHPDELARQIVAFANSGGGRLWLGVEDDSSVTGVGDRQAADDLLTLLDAVCLNNVVPPIACRHSKHEIEGQLVIVTAVPGYAPARPYRTQQGVYHVRGGASVRIASPDDIRRLVMSAAAGVKVPDELPVAGTTLDDLDLARFAGYYRQAYDDVPPAEPVDLQRLLRNLRILTPENLSLMGLLCFGKDPQQFLPWARITAVRSPGTEVGLEFHDRKDCHGTLDALIAAAEDFLSRHLASPVAIRGFEPEAPSTGVRTEYLLPLEAVREAVRNAVVHRDYAVYAHINLTLYDDRLEVVSPGRLLNSVTVEAMKQGAVHLVRNPLIATVLAKRRLMTEQGTGVWRMMKVMQQWGLPPPEIEERGPSLMVTLRMKRAR